MSSTLTSGQKIAQATHAIREFSQHMPKEDSHWYKTSNTVVCLEASPEEMNRLILKATSNKYPIIPWREPDLDHELTALVLPPGDWARKMTSSMRLAK